MDRTGIQLGSGLDPAWIQFGSSLDQAGPIVYPAWIQLGSTLDPAWIQPGSIQLGSRLDLALIQIGSSLGLQHVTLLCQSISIWRASAPYSYMLLHQLFVLYFYILYTHDMSLDLYMIWRASAPHTTTDAPERFSLGGVFAGRG